MNEISDKRLGFGLAITAATLWGVSGACAQYVFEQKGISIEWLVTARLLMAGALLLCYSALCQPAAVWRIWRIWQSRQRAADLLIFGLFGMLAVQYTYFAAIKHSNAATGTVLQYLGPVFIAIYMSLVRRKLPRPAECVAIGLAFLGVLLLVTHGRTDSIRISGWALFWGIASAIALAFYTLHPVRLLRDNDSALVVGWSMIIGGLGFSGFSQPWRVPGHWDGAALAAVAFIIFFGTLAAFYAYLVAVKKIGPQKTSLLACVEPLSATLAAVFWLKIPFGPIDWLGSACIVATIFILGSR